MMDVLELSDRAACVAALTRLQKDVLPRAATTAAARSILQSSSIAAGTNGTDGGGSELGRILLGIAGNSSVAEICREKAIMLLKGLLLKSVASDDDEGEDCAGEAHCLSMNWFFKYYVEYCDTVCRRIASLELCPTSSEREPSESIRLQLLLSLSPLLELLPIGIDDDDDDDDDDNDATILNRAMMEASSQLCRTMAEGHCPVLLDSYSELHRKGCHVLMRLAVKASSAVSQHSSVILRKLVGASTGEDPISASWQNGLMSHRHAKTRCVALDTVAAILCCCDTGRIDTLLESARVLSRWEEGPVFDRSAQVRMSMQRSVGKVSRKLVYSFLDDQSGGDERLETKTSTLTVQGSRRVNLSSIGCRLLSLNFVGLSDDVECVRNIALEEMHSLGGGERGDGSVIVQDMLPRYANVMLLNFLQDANRLSVASNKRARILRAAARLLVELTETSNMNSVLTVGDDSNVAAARGTSAMVAVSIASSLCACLNDNATEVYEAAFYCGRVLGADCFALDLLIGPVLDSLHYDKPSVALVGEEHPPSGCGVSSSLSLLESLLRGHSAAFEEKTSGYDGLHLRLRDVGAALHSEIVLDAIFTKDEKATVTSTVVGACDAFVDVVVIEASSYEQSDVSMMVEHILIATMYLLAATNETDVNAATSNSSRPHQCTIDAILGKATAIRGCDHNRNDVQQSRSRLMRCKFRNVLSALQLKGGSEAMQHLSSRQLGAVDALMRSSGGEIVAENYDIVGPSIFDAHASASSLTVRFSLMTLLESVASDGSFAETIDQSSVSSIIENVILPNLIWEAGGLSAALRKISLATLFSLFRGNSIEGPTLTALAPQIFPILRSNLKDDDSSTKELACHCISDIFGRIVDLPALGRKEVHALCTEVSRLLEDESNAVRIAACAALKSFLSIPSRHEFCEARLIIQQLQIHSHYP